MIDLIQYGFTKIKESEKWDEYEGHNFIITIYHYHYLTSDQKEVARNTFVIKTKETTSRPFDISELEKWLSDKKMVKLLA